MRTGHSDLPLHTGHAPRWLFSRMVSLSGAIYDYFEHSHSSSEFLMRLSDPFWFQAFGCVLGFDWHSSGLTTTVCGALKEALGTGQGLAVCGGKGAASRKAVAEIALSSEEFSFSTGRSEALARASRLSAKVDSAAVQDGYSLYHHVFMFSDRGEWVVVQQGMNASTRYARRYHWHSGISFVCEPHSGIVSDRKGGRVLDMTSRLNGEGRDSSVELLKEGHVSRYFNDSLAAFLEPGLRLPRHHHIIDMDKRSLESLERAAEASPEDYESLLSVPGLGPKCVRALALVSELVYGTGLSWKDPARFSFAHGGKDGIPYPVDRELYDSTIDTLREAVRQSEVGSSERMKALSRLRAFA